MMGQRWVWAIWGRRMRMWELMAMGSWSMGVKVVRLGVPVGDDCYAVQVGRRRRVGEGGEYRVTKRNMLRTPSSIVTQCIHTCFIAPHIYASFPLSMTNPNGMSYLFDCVSRPHFARMRYERQPEVCSHALYNHIQLSAWLLTDGEKWWRTIGVRTARRVLSGPLYLHTYLPFPCNPTPAYHLCHTELHTLRTALFSGCRIRLMWGQLFLCFHIFLLAPTLLYRASRCLVLVLSFLLPLLLFTPYLGSQLHYSLYNHSVFQLRFPFFNCCPVYVTLRFDLTWFMLTVH